jgi:hypothetical protein
MIGVFDGVVRLRRGRRDLRLYLLICAGNGTD